MAADEVVHIQDVVRRFPKLSRHELAQTLCEHLNWLSSSSAPKAKNCLMLLERLANQELVDLPDKSARGQLTSDKPPSLTHRTDKRRLIQYSLYQVVGREKLGMTGGVGITQLGKHYTTTPKTIFFKPLDRHFRDLLCSQQLQGRIIE
jgi:hypothetical protein